MIRFFLAVNLILVSCGGRWDPLQILLKNEINSLATSSGSAMCSLFICNTVARKGGCFPESLCTVEPHLAQVHLARNSISASFYLPWKKLINAKAVVSAICQQWFFFFLKCVFARKKYRANLIYLASADKKPFSRAQRGKPKQPNLPLKPN